MNEVDRRDIAAHIYKHTELFGRNAFQQEAERREKAQVDGQQPGGFRQTQRIIVVILTEEKRAEAACQRDIHRSKSRVFFCVSVFR